MASKPASPRDEVDGAALSFDLEQHIFYLFDRALLARQRSLEPLLSGHGLTVNHWRILVTLNAHPVLSTNRLSELTHIDRTTLTRTLDRMCERGLVTRAEDGVDKRIKRVSLGEPGRTVLAQVLPVAVDNSALATQGLSEREQGQFKRMLHTVIGNLERG